MTRIAGAVYALALTVWVGGLATLALVVAPAAFGNAPRETAGTIFGAALHVFNRVELVCALLCILAAYVARPSPPTRLFAFRMALLALMTCVVAAIGFWLLPTMDSVRSIAPSRFESLHTLSEKLYGTNLLAGLAIVVLGALEKPSK